MVIATAITAVIAIYCDGQIIITATTTTATAIIIIIIIIIIIMMMIIAINSTPAMSNDN